MTETITPNTPILGPTEPGATVAAALAYVTSRSDLGSVVTPMSVEGYVKELHRLCLLSGIRFEIAFAQACDECNVFRDRRFWGTYGNPVGYGAEETLEHPGQINYTGGRWTPVGAARVHLVHLWLYAVGTTLSESLAPYWSLDTRWALAVAQGYAGTAPTLAGLSGRWAANPNYAVQIAAHANRAFKEITPVAITIPAKPDRPQPTIYSLANDFARFDLEQWQAKEILASKFTKRNGGSPQFIVLHIQDGTTKGSLDYWSSDIVDASSTIMANLDGSILRIIPEADGPWTNGDVINPTAEASEVLALGGNPNNWSLSIEREGKPGQGMPKAQLDAIVWQVETWLIRYPKILEHGWSILRHRFINSATRWRCPDEGTNDQSEYFAPVVAAVNAWLETAEQPAPVPTPPPPVVVPPGPGTTEPPASPYPPGMTEELARRLYGRVTVPWYSKQFVFNPNRSECGYWLARGQRGLKPGEDYTKGEWPSLRQVIRRGRTKNVHAYVWSNGDVFEKVVRKDR